jgi:O-acetyl-ADP-ribose deacetylase (regulator of RNase III)
MIQLVSGNLLQADAEALVNTVNTVGVMGKGLALQFKQAYPANYNAYRAACQRGEVQIGKMFIVATEQLTNPRYIVNFPTKRHWKNSSRLEDIDAGLSDLVMQVRERQITSIAIPALGCANGGLRWDDVRPRIEAAFAALSDVSVLLFPPGNVPDAIAMPVTTRRPRMTPGRAAILGLMQQYTVLDYQLTKLEIQKLAYFLQEAGEPLKLNFVKYHYGPYAETLNYVLQRIEGHFIRGYGDRNNRAAIRLLEGVPEDAAAFLREHQETRERLERVSRLIEGFETPYGMELLATIHWLATREDPTIQQNIEAAIQGVQAWNKRKQQLFRPEHIRVAWNRLHEQQWMGPEPGKQTQPERKESPRCLT